MKMAIEYLSTIVKAMCQMVKSREESQEMEEMNTCPLLSLYECPTLTFVA